MHKKTSVQVISNLLLNIPKERSKNVHSKAVILIPGGLCGIVLGGRCIVSNSL